MGEPARRAPELPDHTDNQAESAAVAVAGAEPAVTIDSNHFRHVLEYFGEDGKLLDENTTRISISCAICLTANLQITNPVFPEPEDVKTETYTLLPACGHVFGYRCLCIWFFTEVPPGMPPRRDCPACRTPVEICDQDHFPLFEIYGSDEPEVQRIEIMDIRETLETPICEECLSLEHAPPQ